MAGTPVIAEDADNLDGTGRPELHRSIGPFQMAFYGLGSMLGSVVCGLIGQAAGQVGNAVWLAFLVALLKNREGEPPSGPMLSSRKKSSDRPQKWICTFGADASALSGRTRRGHAGRCPGPGRCGRECR